MKQVIKPELRTRIENIMAAVFACDELRSELLEAIEAATDADSRESLLKRLDRETDRKSLYELEFFSTVRGAKMYAPKNSAIHRLNEYALWRRCREQLFLSTAKEAVKFTLEDCSVWEQE